MSKWTAIQCSDCGATIRIHREWENPPKICKACKAKRAAQWYELPCAQCGSTIRLHKDWRHPPRFCKACKASFGGRSSILKKPREIRVGADPLTGKTRGGKPKPWRRFDR